MKTKTQAVAKFGSVKNLAAGLGCGIHAIYMMPENLTLKKIDQIRGASIRLGLEDAKHNRRFND